MWQEGDDQEAEEELEVDGQAKGQLKEGKRTRCCSTLAYAWKHSVSFIHPASVMGDTFVLVAKEVKTDVGPKVGLS